MRNVVIIITLNIIMISGCNTPKNGSNVDSEQLINDMKTEGYIAGEIVSSDVEEDCAFTIRMNGDVREFLDPVNLDDKYKIDKLTVWFQFRSLRIPNRCEKARPIEIIEIKLMN